MRICSDCSNRCFDSMFGIDFCLGYEMTSSEEEEIMTAESCPKFKEGTPYCLEPDNYCPSAYARDYSPSNPWDAPGMSIHDFI